MIMRRLAPVLLLAACRAHPSVPAASPAPPVAAPVSAAWHVVLNQNEVYAGTPEARYVVDIALVPPDGSAYQPLRGFASRQPCQVGMENTFCVSFGDEITWGVTCGDTRVNVVLDRDRDLLSFGLSNATTDYCRMTTAVQTVPARGGTVPPRRLDAAEPVGRRISGR